MAGAVHGTQNQGFRVLKDVVFGLLPRACLLRFETPRRRVWPQGTSRGVGDNRDHDRADSEGPNARPGRRLRGEHSRECGGSPVVILIQLRTETAKRTRDRAEELCSASAPCQAPPRNAGHCRTLQQCALDVHDLVSEAGGAAGSSLVSFRRWFLTPVSAQR